jgi:hypothetical protein
MQDPWVVGRKFELFPSKFFTQPENWKQSFQILNLLDYLSSWYKFIMDNELGGEFAKFIVIQHIQENIAIICFMVTE